MKSDFNADRVAELSAYVAEMVSVIQQGEQVPKEELENLQVIVEFLNGLDVTGTGVHIRDGITDSITLDTPLMEAHNGATSMNGNMSGDFPVLASGANAISWTGNVTKVVIQSNWRYL